MQNNSHHHDANQEIKQHAELDHINCVSVVRKVLIPWVVKIRPKLGTMENPSIICTV